MGNQTSSLRYRAAGVLGLLMWVGAGSASAAMSWTSGSVLNFWFQRNQVVYETTATEAQAIPSSASTAQVVGAAGSSNGGAAPNVQPTTTTRSDSRSRWLQWSPWRASKSRDPLLAFGTSKTAEESDTTELVGFSEETVELESLIPSEPITGDDANVLGASGIWTATAGRLEVAVELGTPVLSVASVSGGIGSSSPADSSVPIPATALLMLAGLLGLQFVRRRG